MKLAHHLALALGFTLGMAFAEEVGSEVLPYTGIYAASGLTITETQDSGVTISGWYDAEKTPEDDIDDYMCYAASAANLIALWQNSPTRLPAKPLQRSTTSGTPLQKIICCRT
ncbi:MAG: IdeS/Mac family cysteine endopeptidase [Akkermansia sp.]|nr:IdeS/Mac family cysteine endopeptidase [Akkermansia sp.]